jgi:hypothetical protein
LHRRDHPWYIPAAKRKVIDGFEEFLPMRELKNAVDYFPYIGHELGKFRGKKGKEGPLWQSVIGDLFADKHITDIDDEVHLLGDDGAPLFKEVIVKSIKAHRNIAADNTAVELIVPRHRSLYDYLIGMPVHSRLINRDVMLLAGNNLFVARYDVVLRKYGAVMFLREDAILKRKGRPKVYLTIKRYLQEVFPAYLQREMFQGGKDKYKKDIIIYAGQERNPVTKKRAGGRTKTGHLRQLSPIFFSKFKYLTKKSPTRLYVTPVNLSFSKYPDAPYLVHPSLKKGISKGIRYLRQQNLVTKSYPGWAMRHPEAKLDVIVNYGKPELFQGENFKSGKDILEYTESVKNKIGRLETIFPCTLIFRSMDEDADISIAELEQRARRLYDRYEKLGISLDRVSAKAGTMLPAKELAELAVATLNSNPPLYIREQNTREFLKVKSGRLYSTDASLQRWYANNIRHLDP